MLRTQKAEMISRCPCQYSTHLHEQRQPSGAAPPHPPAARLQQVVLAQHSAELPGARGRAARRLSGGCCTCGRPGAIPLPVLHAAHALQSSAGICRSGFYCHMSLMGVSDGADVPKARRGSKDSQQLPTEANVRKISCCTGLRCGLLSPKFCSLGTSKDSLSCEVSFCAFFRPQKGDTLL